MSLVNCARCGCLNGSAADLCERCGTSLISASAWAAASAPLTDLPARTAAAERLPIDFPSTPFQGMGDALRPTFHLYREHPTLVGKIVFASALPLMAANYAVAAFADSAGWAWLTPVNPGPIFVNALADGALIYAVVTLLRTGAAPSLRESYGWGLRRWWPLFLCMLLVSLLTAVGFLLLFVPGVIVSLVLAVAVPVVVVENRGPVAALERSAQLTSGYRLLILFTGALLWMVVSAVTWLNVGLGETLGGGEVSLFASFIYAGVSQMLNSAFTVFTLHLYLGIRADRGETVSTYDALPAPAAAAVPAS